MIETPTSTDNKTIKIKKPREVRFCVFLFFFCSNFVLWWVFFYAFVKFRKFFITKNLKFIFKLSTIESFYYTEKLRHNFGFFLFLSQSWKNNKGRRKDINKYKWIISVNVSILNG
jgi:hypothetical protein